LSESGCLVTGYEDWWCLEAKNRDKATQGRNTFKHPWGWGSRKRGDEKRDTPPKKAKNGDKATIAEW